MGFWTDYGNGISSHIKAFEFISRHRLWGYFLYPVLLLALLYAFGFYSIFGLGRWLADEVVALILLDGYEGTGAWATVISVLIWMVKVVAGLFVWLILLLVFIRLIRYIVLILCSPMMALLSEKVEEIVTGKTYPFKLGQFLYDVWRGIRVNLRNLLLETGITLLLMIIGWIPVVGYITVPFLWVTGWYFLGFNMMDYTYERRRMKIHEGALFTRRRKGIAIGNGMFFSFLLLLPFAGLIIAPVVSSVAGTLATLQALDEKK
jgi:CysZ protein